MRPEVRIVVARLPPLRALCVFEAAARHGSFARAAVELNVSPAAVTQQIRVLETYLAITLFRRLNRRVILTEAGALYYEQVTAALARVADATQAIHRHLQPEVLVVRSVPSFAAKWLLPRIGTFVAANPDLDLRLDATNEKTEFRREPIDVELRLGVGNWEQLHVEPLARERIVPLCSPKLLGGRLALNDAADLARLPLIHSIKCAISWPIWLAANGLGHLSADRGPRFDRSFMAIDAAAAGLGLALDSALLAQEELRGGTLVCPIASRHDFVETQVWIACPPANLETSKVARFLRWLRSHPELQPDAEPLDPSPARLSQT